ncbi:MAG: hypothetical protein ACOCTG_00085 [Bacteroidota bacterium]
MRLFILPLGIIVLSLSILAGCDDDGTLTQPRLEDTDPETVLFLAEFDDENDGEGITNWTDFADWEVVDGCVDLHGNGFYDVLPESGLYVDLDGSCRQGGTIETKESFVFHPDDRYLLEYWLAGNQRKDEADTVDVSMGDLFSHQHVMPRDQDFTLYSHMITVGDTAEAHLRFSNSGGDHQGALLDLVRIRRIVDTDQ